MARRVSQPARRSPGRARRASGSRNQRIFSALALFTVFAMIIGAIGASVVVDLLNDRGEDPLVVDDGEEDPVEATFRRELAENPNDPEAIANLANYISQTGGSDEALRLYERALALRPDDLSLRLDFAQMLSDTGKYPDAELQFQRIVEADPTNGAALLGLARLYRDWSPPRTEDAIRTYQRVVEVAGDSILVQFAQEELAALGVATPAALGAASPVASPAGS
jgi:tetratricopeptide (TPR) repeat protein